MIVSDGIRGGGVEPAQPPSKSATDQRETFTLSMA